MEKYYAQIFEDKILSISINGTVANEGQNIKISKKIYDDIKKNGVNYYVYKNEEFVLNPDYPKELKTKEREELNKLSLTKREVFLALYKDKGITPEQLKAQITDPEALIEFEYANDYFRGNPLINLIGEKLGYSTEDLDYLFKNGELPAKEEPAEPETEKTKAVMGDKENEN